MSPRPSKKPKAMVVPRPSKLDIEEGRTIYVGRGVFRKPWEPHPRDPNPPRPYLAWGDREELDRQEARLAYYSAADKDPELFPTALQRAGEAARALARLQFPYRTRAKVYADRRGLLLCEDLGALHALAKRIDAADSFRLGAGASSPRYIVTDEQRKAALELGAVECDRRRAAELCKFWRAKREAVRKADTWRDARARE